ncbi:uncharacterized protein A1O9_09747 [Exophiala aquamarina CBS 119918]|uniref:Zn(2)-C6 fungal-type domain-containing protein n=1 Tax=Exophiala aquamarina CBS 119918 TaxID=1182545 RepID=A0A072P2M5_9EURO|nr:uncharacterized protein A1O9_09747 [Exophiala aquamarina CBS 119918]KEF53952.1 hypothetical protein A1O9_09747 [Exophiala aquamarina CBS 119918]
MNELEPIKRTRNRRINTCLECRRLKRRCSRSYPCLHCQKTSRECVFPASKRSTSSTPRDESTGGTSISQPSNPETSLPTEIPVPRRSASTPRVYRKPPDICLRLGKLSITERIGGVLRVDFVQSLEELLEEYPEANSENQFSAPLVAWFKPHTALPLDQLFSRNGAPQHPFPLTEMQEQALINQYFVAVHPVCPLVSMADLEGGGFLTDALRAAVFFAAAMSFPLLQSQKSFGITKDALVTKLKTMAEAAICRADMLSCLDLQMFQVLLIYLTPQLLTEVSRSHSIFIGTVIRHFQIAGLDRDCSTDNATERQLKRHLWQHLLFLNIRAAEAVGPERTAIDDVSAQLPEHDEFLLPQSSDVSNPTYIVALVRYECYKVHRWIFREREPLRRGESSLVSLLDELNQFTLSIYARYLDHLSDNIPIQKYAALVGKLLLARAQGMILTSQRHKWRYPETALGLTDRVIRSCLDVLETAVTLETDPELSQWAWYAGAYQQYHSILFPLATLHQAPHLPEADRIMAMADHVFGPSPTMSPRDRSQTILRAIKNNMASFLATIDPARFPDSKHKGAPAHASADEAGVGALSASSLMDMTFAHSQPYHQPSPYRHLQHSSSHIQDAMSSTHGVPTPAAPVIAATMAATMEDHHQMFYAATATNDTTNGNYFGISPTSVALDGVAAADTWWKWPPQLDQDDLFRELNIF